MNSLQQLSKYTTIVADTGDLGAIKRLKPIDATTNPSLITKAFVSGEHDDLVLSIKGMDTDIAIDHLTVQLGKLILDNITGRVSTEVDARLSFDTQATITKAHEFIEMYQKLGVDPARILIKIAATKEGIHAAKTLEKDGIHCNLTLLFTDAQARVCADAGVTLISPFVGRITDWQKKAQNKSHIDIADDMGVNSVKQIYEYYKLYDYQTQVMGASFRSIEQILALAGCDLLTIAPNLLDELANLETPISAKLIAPTQTLPKSSKLTDSQFDEIQNNHPLNELLMVGIEGFVKARQELADKLLSL